MESDQRSMTSITSGIASGKKRNEKRASEKMKSTTAATQTTHAPAAGKELVSPDPVFEINRLATAVQISDRTSKRALEIYEMAQSKHLDRGRSILALQAASLYAACRNTGTTNTLKEISKASDVRIRALARMYRLLLNQLEFQVTVTDPAACVSIVAGRAGLNDEKTIALALKILRDKGVIPSLAGKEPMGVAAAALYMACNRSDVEAKSQEEIAKAAGVTEVTIRNRSMEMKLVMKEKSLINDRSEDSGIPRPKDRTG